ncbi:hypothetical protein [Staphylococcus aureus]
MPTTFGGEPKNTSYISLYKSKWTDHFL